MTEFNVLGALALASIASFAATQSTNVRPAAVRTAQSADSLDRSARANSGLEQTNHETIKY
ncbi:MAG TPA: hypothetical protein VL574_08670 [Stellaceae bacterium]|nr:hypothetical protein [Stellaceae bacterium]